MKSLLVLVALSATAAAAQQTPAYGSVPSYGQPSANMPNSTPNPGSQSYRFRGDAASAKAARDAAKTRKAAAKAAATTPAAPPAS